MLLYELFLTVEERGAIEVALKEEYGLDMAEIAYICIREAEGEFILLSTAPKMEEEEDVHM